MNIGKRIKELRGERSVQECADAVGVSRSAWYQWEEKEADQDITHRNLIALAKFFEMSVEEFVTGEPPSVDYSTIKFSRPTKAEQEAGPWLQSLAEPDNDVVYVPFIEAQVSAGAGALNHTEEIKELHQYTRTWIDRNGYHAPALRRVKVTGRSMERTLFDGDVALVNTADKRITNGKVYSFLVDGEARVKRLYKQMDGKIRAVSDNADKTEFPDEFLTPDHMPEMIGRVVDRSGKADL